MKATAFAPSKVIVTGEHFVVHGSWALAAAIGKGVSVTVEDADRLTLSSDRFPRSTSGALAPLTRVVESLANAYGFSKSIRVTVSSEVPDGAGLGSSAATMVALASAVSELRGIDLRKDEVILHAMAGEKEVHGRPSGIDPAACALGGVILFRAGQRPKAITLQGSRRLLVVYSGRKRSTSQLISRVSGVNERFPHFFAGLAASVSELSQSAASRLAEGDMRGVGRLLLANHAILSGVGASTPELDGLVDLMLSLGCHGAKLTGAGGGGSVLAVAPEGKVKSVISEVKGRGFEAFESVIPVNGVKSWQGL